MWLRTILISCEIYCSIDVLRISVKSRKSQAAVFGSDSSRAFSEIFSSSMNGKLSLWSYPGGLGTVLGL